MLQKQTELVELERRVLNEYSTLYRAWYFFSTRMLGKLNPPRLWWYSKLADRAYRRYLAKSSDLNLRKVWVQAEFARSWAEGCVYVHATAELGANEDEVWVVVANVLRRRRHNLDKAEVTQCEPDVARKEKHYD